MFVVPWFVCHHKICRLINQVTSSGENLPAPFFGGQKAENMLPGGLRKVPGNDGVATAPSHHSKVSEEEVKGAGQQGENPSTLNISSAGKLRGNAATRKMEGALWLLFSSLGRRACPGSKNPGSTAACVCQEKEVSLIMEK